MSGKNVLWLLAAVVVFAFAVLHFSRFGSREVDSDPMVLQSYAVPPEIASELHAALASAMSQGKHGAPLGQVTSMPNGHILVAAPISIQGNVRRLIDEINQSKPAPTPTIRFDTWIVRAAPGKEAHVSDNLADVEPALAVIRKSKGPLDFDLVEKLSTVTRSGHEESRVRGAESQMEVQASLRKANGDEQVVAAKLNIQTGTNRGPGTALQAQTELKPGELLVVGQSELSAPQGSPRTDAQVYYIVRATL